MVSLKKSFENVSWTIKIWILSLKTIYKIRKIHFFYVSDYFEIPL